MAFVASKRGKYYTGVALDREVTAYVDDMAHRMGWSRSITLNFIVRDYVQRKGDYIVLSAPRKTSAEKKSKST